MFALRRPSLGEIEAFLAAQRKHSFSYHDVGATRRQVPSTSVVFNTACILTPLSNVEDCSADT
jgi:hypothetical protein